MSAGALKIGRQKVQRATAWVKRMKPKIFTVGSAPENPQLRKRGKLNPWLVTSSHRIVWGFVLSDFGKVFGLLGVPVLPIFFAICSIFRAGSCHFNDIFNILEFGPIICHDICNMLVLEPFMLVSCAFSLFGVGLGMVLVFFKGLFGGYLGLVGVSAWFSIYLYLLRGLFRLRLRSI